MNAQKKKRLLFVASIALILFHTAVIAGIAGFMHGFPANAQGIRNILAPHNSNSVSAKALAGSGERALTQNESKGRVKGKCAECGLIESMLEIDGHDRELARVAVAGGMAANNRLEPRAQSPKRYKITVRMADGSRRVINNAGAGSWRPGERVILIDGANPLSARKLR